MKKEQEEESRLQLAGNKLQQTGNGLQSTGVKEQDLNIEKKKLSYKEKREFELLQKEIGELEKEKKDITDKLNSNALPYEQLQQFSNRIGEISQLLDQKEMRWLQLSEMMESI